MCLHSSIYIAIVLPPCHAEVITTVRAGVLFSQRDCGISLFESRRGIDESVVHVSSIIAKYPIYDNVCKLLLEGVISIIRVSPIKLRLVCLYVKCH